MNQKCVLPWLAAKLWVLAWTSSVVTGQFYYPPTMELPTSFSDPPRPEQASLVIVFDTTWSMDDDLQELRAGAEYIVKEMMKKSQNPIYNYVFAPFNDPCEFL